MQRVSHDTLFCVCTYLSFADWKHLALVCKHWYSLAQYQSLWKMFWASSLQQEVSKQQEKISQDLNKKQKQILQKQVEKTQKKYEMIKTYKLDKAFCNENYLNLFKQHVLGKTKERLKLARDLLIGAKQRSVELWMAYLQDLQQASKKLPMYADELYATASAKIGKHNLLFVFLIQSNNVEDDEVGDLVPILRILTSAPFNHSIFQEGEHKMTPFHYVILQYAYHLVVTALEILKSQIQNGIVGANNIVRHNMPMRYAIECRASEDIVKLLQLKNAEYCSLFCHSDMFLLPGHYIPSPFCLTSVDLLLKADYSLELLQKITEDYKIDWFAENAFQAEESALSIIILYANDLTLDKTLYMLAYMREHPQCKQLVKKHVQVRCLRVLGRVLRRAMFAHRPINENIPKMLSTLELMLQIGIDPNIIDPNAGYCFVQIHFTTSYEEPFVRESISNMLLKYGANLHEHALVESCCNELFPTSALLHVQWLLKHGKVKFHLSKANDALDVWSKVPSSMDEIELVQRTTAVADIRKLLLSHPELHIPDD